MPDLPRAADIRQFLFDYFSDEELSTLCFDFFPEVHDDFTTGMAKQQKTRMLLKYCQHREIVPNLLGALQRARPEPYEKRFPQAPRAAARAEPVKPVRDPKRVFISHAHEDAEFAHRLANDLQQNGWRVWIALDSIRPGEKWAEVIERGLSESGVFIVALTCAAVQSSWVRRETFVAIELEEKGQMRFVPLAVEPCDAPYLWGAYQRIPFEGDYGSGLTALLDALEPERRARREREAQEQAARARAEQVEREMEQRRLAAQAEAERRARLAAEKAEAEQRERERQEREARQRFEADRQAREEAERQAKLAAEKAEAERLERERQEREARAAAAQLEVARQAQLDTQKAAAATRERERQEREARATAAQLEAARQAQLVAQKVAAARRERERQERTARLERILARLRDPLWQGIGAIVAIAALAVALGVWLRPDVHAVLFPPATPVAVATLTGTKAPTAIAALTSTPALPSAPSTLTPTATRTPTIIPSPTPMPTITPSPMQTPSTDSTRIVEKDGMVMVYVPAGEFLMGSTDGDKDAHSYEKPQHKVYLDAFWIDQTEVTNAQYKQCVQAQKCQEPSSANDSKFNGDNQPVVSVDWNDAKNYCEWTGRRLPTEAEWEKAARGTDGRIYPWGNQTATCEYAVMNDGSGGGCGKGDTDWAVGSKPKGISPYGAYDMAGNVWEWTSSLDKSYPYRSNDGRENPNDSGKRVMRSGSWYFAARIMRTANRSSNSPDTRYDNLGFRCSR